MELQKSPREDVVCCGSETRQHELYTRRAINNYFFCMDTEAIVQNLDAEIRRLEKARALLTGRRGVAPRVSAEGRAKIAAAQRKRWAAKKK